MRDDQRRVLIQFSQDCLERGGDSDPLPLGLVMRLNYIGGRRGIELLLQLVQLLREDVSFRQEIKIGQPVLALHFGDSLVHEILPGDMVGVGEMVDFLVGQQVAIDLWLNDSCGPIYGPVDVLFAAVTRGGDVFKPILIQ